MADDKIARLINSIPRLGRRAGREADGQQSDPLQAVRDPLLPDKVGWRLLSPHIRKTKLPLYTELAIPDGNSVLLLHEYEFNERQLDQIRHNVGRARANVAAGIDALACKDSSQYDSRTAALLKRHFLLDVDKGATGDDFDADGNPDPKPDTMLVTDNILRRLRKISAGLDGPNVEIKVLDDLRTRSPEATEHTDGLARMRFSRDETPRVSFRIRTVEVFDAERGPQVMIHETAHNVAALDDHGERGYFDSYLTAGQPMRYRESGLTSCEALRNADTYAGFCCDLQRCPPSVKWSLPSTEVLHFGSNEPEDRFKHGVSASAGISTMADGEHADSVRVGTDSTAARPSSRTRNADSGGLVERERSSLGR